MKKISEQFRIAKLLLDEILGKVPPEGTEELKNWKEKHNQTYHSIYNWENYELRKKKLSAIDVSREWQFFLEAKNKNQTKIIRLKFLRYAAAVILTLSLAGSVYWVSNYYKRASEIQVAVVDIPPGEKKAELILSNGKTVSLNPEYMNDLKEADGTIISNDSVMLSYQDTKSKNKDKAVLYNTLKIARGGEYYLVLQDGSKVWLNSMSSLKYPVRFTENNRTVELTGEAYFEVAKDPTRPFIVKTTNYDINVLGTSFNISSYAGDNTVTTLVEGSIQISNISGSIESNIKLTANDQLILNKTDLSISVQKVDAGTFCSWINGSFSFENETIENVFLKLERWYDIDVSFTNEKIKTYEYTGELPRFENFEVILEMLEIISEVQITVNGNKVIISEK